MSSHREGRRGGGPPSPTWAPFRALPRQAVEFVFATAPGHRIHWVVQAPCLPGRRKIPFHSLIPFLDGSFCLQNMFVALIEENTFPDPTRCFRLLHKPARLPLLSSSTINNTTRQELWGRRGRSVLTLCKSGSVSNLCSTQQLSCACLAGPEGPRYQHP